MIEIQFKEESHKQVLNTIRISQKISAAQLSRICKLQPSTVHYILQHFKSQHLIEKAGIGEPGTSGGKPSVLWQLNKSFGYVLGIELLKTRIRYCLIDFACNIIDKNEKNFTEPITELNILENCRQLVDDVLISNKINQSNLIGLGIGITGLVDFNGFEVIFSRELGLSRFSLKTELEKILNIPIYLINDANAGALGYVWYHETPELKYNNVVYFTINTDLKNIGTGIVLNKTLYKGANGIAGEIFTQLPSIEKLLLQGIEKFGKQDPLIEKFKHSEKLTLDNVLAYRNDSSPIATYILFEITSVINTELRNVIGILNPEAVVIGGNITDMNIFIQDYLFPHLQQYISTALNLEDVLPPLIVAPGGRYSVALGATAMVLMKTYKI